MLHNFNMQRRGWLLNFGTPRGIIWRTLHSRRILHASGAIIVQDGVLLGETRTRCFLSGAKCSADWSTITFDSVIEGKKIFITFFREKLFGFKKEHLNVGNINNLYFQYIELINFL